MKKLIASMIVLAGTGLGAAAWAADPMAPAPSSAPSGSDGVTQGQTPSNNGQMSKSDLIGRKLLDSKGKQVGEVKDVVTDAQGQPVNVIVDTGKKNVALPASEIKVASNDALQSDKSAAAIRKLPAADSQAPSGSDMQAPGAGQPAPAPDQGATPAPNSGSAPY